MGSPRLKVTRDNVDAVLRSIREMSQRQVLVGIPATADARKPDPDEPNHEINNATIGYLMENGSPAANIPARPHMKSGVASVQAKIAQVYRTGGKLVLEGKPKALDEAHTKVGLIAQAAVKTKITTGTFVPLAPATIAARRRRGRTSIKPLIDSGQYRNAITFVIRQRGR